MPIFAVRLYHTPPKVRVKTGLSKASNLLQRKGCGGCEINWDGKIDNYSSIAIILLLHDPKEKREN